MPSALSTDEEKEAWRLRQEAHSAEVEARSPNPHPHPDSHSTPHPHPNPNPNPNAQPNQVEARKAAARVLVDRAHAAQQEKVRTLAPTSHPSPKKVLG